MESEAKSIVDVDLVSLTDHSQNGEQAVIGRYFQELTTGYTPLVVDVGAYDGLTGSNSRMLIELGWQGLLIEPTPTVFARLETLYADNPKVNCLPLAISDYRADGVELMVAQGPEGVPDEITWHYSQVSTLNSWFADRYVAEHGYRYQKVEVAVRPLTQVLVEEGCPKDLGLLLVDCEGEDLKILTAFDFDRFRPRLVSVECDDRNRGVYRELLAPSGYEEVAHTAANGFFGLVDRP